MFVHYHQTLTSDLVIKQVRLIDSRFSPDWD